MAALPEAVGPGDEFDELEDDEPETSRPSDLARRDAQLLGRSDSRCRKWLGKRFSAIRKGFEEQAERANTLDEYWNCYHCERDDNTYYNGEAEIYVPTVHDAVNALVTRYANQLMPQLGRYVDVTATDGEQPYEVVALVNHYIKAAKFKPLVLKPLLRNGFIEGQYNLYLDWQEISRRLVSRETRGVLTEGPDPSRPPVESDAAELIVDIKEEQIVEGRPLFEVLHDADVLVLPATADSIEEALEVGGSVTIVRRFSKDALKALAEKEDLDLDLGQDERGRPRTDLEGDHVVFAMSPEMTGLVDIEKKLARDVGLKVRGKHAILFEVWQKVPLSTRGSFNEKGDKQLCKTWYALSGDAIGLKRNPHWNDRCPLLSEPVEKQAGVFKGKSQIEAIAQLQYESNDAANERADVDHMSAMPIVMRRAEDGNQPLLIAKGAIWEYSGPTPPQFAAFPDLSGRATARVMAARQLIFQSLSVSPAMLPQQSGTGSKRNQAEVAMEQQVDLLTTAEGVDVMDALLTEMVERVVDFDHQYRERAVTIRQYGELGIKAEMVDVPPYRNRFQYDFQWIGSVQMRMNVAMQQNGTALINIARGMADQLKGEGLELSLGTLLEYQFASVFGPTIARKTLRDLRRELAMDPAIENQMLEDGHEVPTNLFDQDQQHLQSHQQAMRRSGDPHGTFRVHIQWHLKQLQTKNMAQMQQLMQQGGAPGVPGGVRPGGAPGVAGTPRPAQPPMQGPRIAGTPPGAVPMQPRQMVGPPGRIPPTALPRAGAVIPPRRM